MFERTGLPNNKQENVLDSIVSMFINVLHNFSLYMCFLSFDIEHGFITTVILDAANF